MSRPPSSSSFHTAEPTPDYGLSEAAVCLDFFAEVPMLPRDCLLGQRAISKAQLAREGSNVHVVRHVRQNLEHSYKELFVDVTGKLPAFARAVLPAFVLYMENCVDVRAPPASPSCRETDTPQYPTNTATLACLKPARLRGTSAFSETVYCDVGETPVFTIELPHRTALPYSKTKVDYQTGWKHSLPPQQRAPVQGVVHKRFLLDVGANGIFWRRLRGFLLRKFQEAFVDMLREVELCVRAWDGDGGGGSGSGSGGGATAALAAASSKVPRRPRFESAFSPEIAPKPRLWPQNGMDLRARAAKLAVEFAQRCKLESAAASAHGQDVESPPGSPEAVAVARGRAVSSSFFLPE